MQQLLQAYQITDVIFTGIISIKIHMHAPQGTPHRHTNKVGRRVPYSVTNCLHRDNNCAASVKLH